MSGHLPHPKERCLKELFINLAHEHQVPQSLPHHGRRSCGPSHRDEHRGATSAAVCVQPQGRSGRYDAPPQASIATTQGSRFPKNSVVCVVADACDIRRPPLHPDQQGCKRSCRDQCRYFDIHQNAPLSTYARNNSGGLVGRQFIPLA